MSVEIKKLTVATDDERKQWMQLLTKASDYHYDMSAHFDDEDVSAIHRAWGRAIQDAVALIDMWELESDDEILTPPNTKKVIP